MKKIIFTAMLLFFGTTIFAQNIDVVFNVDMSVQISQGNFNPGSGDFVVVRGSFQADAGDPGGNWQGTLYTLTAGANDVYSITVQIPATLAGTNYEFKYVTMPGDGWEGVDNRTFTLSNTSPQVLPTVYFNNDDGGGAVNTIEFIADITGILGVGAGGAFDPNQDSLQVVGLDWNGGSNVTGNRTTSNTDPFNPGIYTTTLSVTATSDSTSWKFKAFPGDRFSGDGWESGSDRWYVYGPNGTNATVGPIVPRIFPLFPPFSSPVELTINVDMTGAVNRYNGLPIDPSSLEFVGMRGGTAFLGSWSAAGGNWVPADTGVVVDGYPVMRVLTNTSGNIWTFNEILPIGTSAGNFEYKFAAMYPGADTVNGGGSPLDNEAPSGTNHVYLFTDQNPTITLNHQFGVFTTDVKQVEDMVPAAYQLEQNYPNPFNPSTIIRYNIPQAGIVSLRVFNLLGEEVALLVNMEQAAGVYEVNFDAAKLSSGIYFYTLEANNYKATKKMILIK